MITTVIVQIAIDEDNNTYEIGDRVRVKMKPIDVKQSEYIGYIDDITEDMVYVATNVGVRNLLVDRIDKIRLAAEDENFDNQWEF